MKNLIKPLLSFITLFKFKKKKIFVKTKVQIKYDIL